MPHRGAGRTASELEWLRVNDYLRSNRYELAVRAADGYPAGARVAGTPLLAAPEWLPGTPIPLERVRLSLEPEAPQPRITATDIKTIAPALLPERPGGTPYRRHSDVIGELAAPAVFENRVTYRLTGADLAGEGPHLGFTLGRFFDGIDVGGAAAHEYAAAELDPGKGRPLRAAIKDPCDLAARPHAMAVGALTLRHDRAARTASFPLHWRDPRRVGHAGGMFQVIPVGIFQPSGEAEWNVATDFSLWRGLLREYAEELLGADEDHGSETAPIDYESWPLARRMTGALGDGRIRAWCLGLGADPLTFAMDLLTVVVIDAPLYDELFGAAVTDNAEGTVLPLRPFDAPAVRELLGNHPVQAAGAALLTLALAHRDTLLAGLPGALLPAALAPSNRAASCAAQGNRGFRRRHGADEDRLRAIWAAGRGHVDTKGATELAGAGFRQASGERGGHPDTPTRRPPRSSWSPIPLTRCPPSAAYSGTARWSRRRRLLWLLAVVMLVDVG